MVGAVGAVLAIVGLVLVSARGRRTAADPVPTSGRPASEPSERPSDTSGGVRPASDPLTNASQTTEPVSLSPGP